MRLDVGYRGAFDFQLYRVKDRRQPIAAINGHNQNLRRWVVGLSGAGSIRVMKQVAHPNQWRHPSIRITHTVTREQAGERQARRPPGVKSE